MRDVHVSTPVPQLTGSTPGQPRGGMVLPVQAAFDWDMDDPFTAMSRAYLASGGIAPAQELLALFKRSHGPDVATLARWVAEREVICFEWQSQTWLPMFQFNRADLAPDKRLRPLFSELTRVYDHWEMATWFAVPNPWLGQRTPVDVLATDLSAVLDAARADRFIVNG